MKKLALVGALALALVKTAARAAGLDDVFGGPSSWMASAQENLATIAASSRRRALGARGLRPQPERLHRLGWIVHTSLGADQRRQPRRRQIRPARRQGFAHGRNILVQAECSPAMGFASQAASNILKITAPSSSSAAQVQDILATNQAVAAQLCPLVSAIQASIGAVPSQTIPATVAAAVTAPAH
jgi:hypothetical protein